MTYIASIAPESDIYAALDHADATMPGWWEASQRGDRFLSERDFPIADADDSEMTLTDWEFVAEMTWSDPADRDY